MKNIFKFLFILFLGVICCACVNTVAVHELNQKASKYLEEGNLDAAIARLEASVDLDANVYESRYNLASAYVSAGKCEHALEHINVAVELNSKEPVVHYTRGVAAQCIADKIIKEHEDGSVLSSAEHQHYVDMIKIANESFDNYLSLAPGAEDFQSVLGLIKQNEAKIGQNSTMQ